ncbi:hypothetical protein LCGC14_1869740, partial [marine sediment metagenome]
MKFNDYVSEYKSKINSVIKSIFNEKLNSVNDPFLK